MKTTLYSNKVKQIYKTFISTKNTMCSVISKSTHSIVGLSKRTKNVDTKLVLMNCMQIAHFECCITKVIITSFILS